MDRFEETRNPPYLSGSRFEFDSHRKLEVIPQKAISKQIGKGHKMTFK